MSARPGISVDAKIPADGGEHPNKFRPEVSVHIRASWPPLATEIEVKAAMYNAIDAAWDAIAEKRAE